MVVNYLAHPIMFLFAGLALYFWRRKDRNRALVFLGLSLIQLVIVVVE